MKEKKRQAAVFLDRDGTINEEVGYLDRIEKLRLIPGAAEAIRLINKSGMKAVVVTNQSGVARGMFDEGFVHQVNTRLREMLRAEGAFLDGIYFCPHHPTEGRGNYLMSCDCRKPSPGLLLRAEEELRLDLAHSCVIGDTLKDIEAGTRAGMKGVLVRTGYGGEEILKLEREGSSRGPLEKGPAATSRDAVRQADPRQPYYIAADILEAVQWILRDRKP
ncbi:MAG: D-glycero-beta-D-manno-heptose 1,7-bisphosphate 7-phosphatase [Proteobacteria bacterium]|nr:D-glycero-beta-D-manno-heptose 1,7-bisphosphate 7-phosphatase [Pseudomonadota bacterium]MBU2226832.1 D-glycero-beta-D-manno-heptose 1,7-bisphosphate 7-phosphatase [Pseudomonadota bacterium]MBU2262097.1 D-glycero-beta-D-manno-heptose 1,7-bisphosphate 7-phosphatase [Pseudomonadota bacterium]